MYSVQQLGMIRNKEREQIRKIKEVENANKNIELLVDILNTKDFTFKKYYSGGDSGSLLLATNKKDKTEKYIVKHEYFDCACNEYIYSKIGNEMGIGIAPVKLFKITDKKKLFKSDFVCGIKYYEESERVGYKYIKEHKNEIENWKDYFKFKGMENLFLESDGIEVIKKDKFIYRIDTTSSFSLSHMYIEYLGYEGKFEEIDIGKFVIRNIMKLANFDENNMLKNWEISLKIFKEDANSQELQYYLEPFYKFLDVEDNKIQKWCDTICYFYPDVIGEFYKTYFKNTKKCIRKFIEKNK